MTAPDLLERQRLDTRHRIGVYGWSPGDGGVHHHRIEEPLRVLAALGTTAETGVELDDEILNRVDTVLAHTLHGERESAAWERLAALGTHRLVLDVDDAMWRPDWPVFQRHYTPDVLRRLYRNVSIAHVITTPSPLIAEHLSAWNANVHVVPNTIPEWVLDPKIYLEKDLAGPTLLYQGSPSHAADFTGPVKRQIVRFLVDHPDWELHTVGPGYEGPADLRIRCTPWIENRELYYRTLAGTVGIGPMRDTLFNRCKSSLRAVEFCALGIVPVLPDLEPYRHWVVDGVNGRLYGPHQTLRRVLAEVADNPDWIPWARQRGFEAARNWTTEHRITDWIGAWESR